VDLIDIETLQSVQAFKVDGVETKQLLGSSKSFFLFRLGNVCTLTSRKCEKQFDFNIGIK